MKRISNKIVVKYTEINVTGFTRGAVMFRIVKVPWYVMSSILSLNRKNDCFQTCSKIQN